ncbi:D-alanyl-D-alanine carboxypeptidase [Arthrobacter saudimassiliensis]|uniref:D-alanyl-D-alanine carboxypeptidase n=1 Tax=Arthrobacter saudimassiliensis TaxID=1461584 RepID=A0A078MNC0_9MICC|nr:D-alanyl-D-alanine carboxypeptidase [Arthrobacter saudimassiliensis]
MAYFASLRTRDRRTRRVLLVSIVALCLAFLTAYVLTFVDWTPHAGGASGQHLAGPAADPADHGVTAEGVPVFDDTYPTVTNLDPALLGALRTAATDAAAAGVGVVVTSGWRSPEYQERLLDDAVIRYGSEQEASRWVATAETSAHVHGDAVDVGPYTAIDWLAVYGSAYGLCQTYANEPWHFELRPEAATQGCPAMYADPASDPRMHPAGW